MNFFFYLSINKLTGIDTISMLFVQRHFYSSSTRVARYHTIPHNRTSR